MTNHNWRLQALAACLAALAGYVDASGFMATGGFFVSFMSGNSTRMGIGIAESAGDGLIAAGLIGVFLFGVIAGAIAGHAAGRRRRPVLLGSVAIMLAGTAALKTSGGVALLAAAMGMINNVFEQNGEVSIGVTYMTGSLVKLGQRIAAAILGRDRLGWVSYLVLWVGFVVGVTSGSLAYQHLGLSCLWGATFVAGTLAVGEWIATDAMAP